MWVQGSRKQLVPSNSIEHIKLCLNELIETFLNSTKTICPGGGLWATQIFMFNRTSVGGSSIVSNFILDEHDPKSSKLLFIVSSTTLLSSFSKYPLPDFPWKFYMILTGLLWNFYVFLNGIPMRFTQDFYGCSMGFLWTAHGIPIGFPWYFKNMSKGFLSRLTWIEQFTHPENSFGTMNWK